ncbi:hypothetical protein MVEN_00816700 [Mycena venus]|uniref:Uncharacterized protein n=1 Tax=Mycena venus TaxID=2733690 RepID=A0A8H6YG88_9AGAR|nr:hypothetical protein MVEN_00816700 [Mycena venus]
MSSTAQQSFVAVDDSFSNVTPSVIHFVFTLVAQTFVFGVYTLLLCLSTRLLLKRGLEIRANRVMLSLTLFMYILSIGYWAFFIVYAVDLLRAHINVAAKPLSDHDEITRWLPLVNSIAMIIFVLSDGVLIWRAWAIGQRQLRKYLWFSMGFLGLAAVAVVLAISFRMASFFKKQRIHIVLLGVLSGLQPVSDRGGCRSCMATSPNTEQNIYGQRKRE